MPLVTSRPAARRQRWWAALGGCAVVVAVVGLLALGRWPAVAVWVLLGGAVVAHWAGRRASDCATLVALADLPLSQIAVAPARVPARSETPVADLMRIRAAGCGLVTVDGAPRVLPAARVDECAVERLLSGRWADMAVGTVELDGDLPAGRLGRLPDEGETWLVRTPVALLALSADVLRAGAAAASRRRARRPGAVETGAPSATAAGTSRVRAPR